MLLSSRKRARESDPNSFLFQVGDGGIDEVCNSMSDEEERQLFEKFDSVCREKNNDDDCDDDDEQNDFTIEEGEVCGDNDNDNDKNVDQIDHLALFDFLECKANECAQRREKNDYIPPVSQSYMENRYQKHSVEGDMVVREIVRCWDEFKSLTWTPQQKKMLELSLRSSLPAIYGNSWEIERDRVLKENDWKDASPLLLAVTPRRFGKSTAIAGDAATMIMCVPNYSVVIVAVRLRQTKMLLQMIYTLFQDHPKSKGMKVITINKEELAIKGNIGNDIRTVKAFPSTTAVCLFFILFNLGIIACKKKGMFVLLFIKKNYIDGFVSE